MVLRIPEWKDIKKWFDDNVDIIPFILSIVTIIGLILLIITFITNCNSRQYRSIKPSMYDTVEEWVDETPSLKAMVLEKLSNDTITYREYNDIKAEKWRLDKIHKALNMKEKLRK